ncbi:GNAT family N-acetyltransferase [Pontibacter akesuensis]|uniref:Protein N-acetyltransferase, RimJ/RimL family n=1 Tax=Pontibacter akesuensis TaxID=388950 RepID=A0A1I7JFR2_9BACT|nr:GNAT family protein [Pontibacter akesuensis]GHA70273.1 ribosomal protein N-acetyltransferase [Pontibacter akesuensis]SFU84018.1 Protein N-acetyltransferase, RimJ/RimL family [Pontibacter akesuensis]
MSYLYNTLSDAPDGQLETTNLSLRPYQDGDEHDFIRLLQENLTSLDPAFSGRLARVRVLDDARSQVRQLRSEWENRRTFDFGVWRKEDKAYIGDIALKNLDRSVPKAEVGLYFTAWPATHDLAQEALGEALRFAFNSLGMNKLYLRCTSANESYGTLAESCGFLKEGVLRNDYRGADSEELVDLSYYGLTRSDFEELQQRHAQNSTAVV